MFLIQQQEWAYLRGGEEDWDQGTGGMITVIVIVIIMVIMI